MRILIAAVGRLKPGPEKELFEAYRRRIAWPIAVREVEARGAAPAELKAREAELLLGALAGRSSGKRPGRPASGRRVVVALDERGEAASSADFARRIGTWRDQGVEEIAFAIGGADGLDEGLRGRADWLLALGRLTWPHLLVRALLAEQLYRAQQILAGHPYHRK
ncbi:MAG: ribosomal RNA large subunit methyltransferase H [Alphaproteobacteria bacterium]|nr:MAG: ribosomal RNA large subunit methyltransferase H [Alphaproteobacteria bacterium]